MRIWVFASGEPLPSQARHARLLRAGNLCKHLSEAGHQVVWWTSSYDHIRKEQVQPQDLPQLPRLEFRLLRSPGYKANLGVARLFDHAVLGMQFRRQAAREAQRPDVIWCSYPPIESAASAVAVARGMGVPVVLDVRDLWPDVFLDVVPPFFRGLGRALLWPYFSASSRALRRTTAIAAVTEPYLAWALRRGGRARGPFDRCFPMGYPDFDVPDSAMHDAVAFWRERGVQAGNLNLCFFGTLGRQFDIATVLQAAAALQQRASSARFIFCGDGSALESLRAAAAGLHNVLFAGHVHVPEIKALMDISSVGLAPYEDTENFQLNIPNKVFEYAAGSLPTLSSVDGEVGRFLREHGIGWVYPARDAAALADRILALEQQRGELKTMGHRARDVFAARFDARIVSAQIEACLTELVAANPSSPHRI